VFVHCSLCGGENRLEPGEALLACSFCGASLALEQPKDVERLVLTHTRDDRMAEASLRSHLAEKNRRPPTRVEIDFSYVPFSMIEADDGRLTLAPAARVWPARESSPYPPAGKYDFFDEAAVKERVAPAREIDPRAARVLHLPVYSMKYEAGEWRGRAAVVGESWQIVAEKLPPERPRRAGAGQVVAGAALFAGYFALAKMTPGLFGSLAAVAAAATAGYCVFALRERAKG
jgi:hypothetical protein